MKSLTPKFTLLITFSITFVLTVFGQGNLEDDNVNSTLEWCYDHYVTGIITPLNSQVNSLREDSIDLSNQINLLEFQINQAQQYSDNMAQQFNSQIHELETMIYNLQVELNVVNDGITQEVLDMALPLEINKNIELPQGWSMFGYNCLDSVDVIISLNDIKDNIEIVKDEWGLSYIPSWEFNALGHFKHGEGYQIKLYAQIDSFHFCETLIAQIPGCMNDTMFNYNPDANIEYENACIPIILGCTNSMYLEYNYNANTNDGSCTTIVIPGCTDPSAVNYNEDADMDNGSCNYDYCNTVTFDQWPTTATVGDLVSTESNNNDWEITYPGYEGVLVQQHPDYPQLVIELTHPDGSYKNIGIGGPTTDYSPEFHSEWYGLNLAPVILQKLVSNQFNANQAGLVYVTTSSPHPNPSVTVSTILNNENLAACINGVSEDACSQAANDLNYQGDLFELEHNMELEFCINFADNMSCEMAIEQLFNEKCSIVQSIEINE